MTYFEQNNDPTAKRVAEGLGKLALALRQNSWQEAMPKSLTPTQGQVLTLLAARPGIGLAQVAEALGVRPPTASDAVRVLESKGWVDKTRRPEDGRALILSLTSEGREIARQASHWPDFLASAVDELPNDEQETLLRALMTLIRTLQERDQIPVSAMCVTCRHFRPFAHGRSSSRPHHCALVDAPFGDPDLRIECPEHEPAPVDEARDRWNRWARNRKSS